MRTHKCRIEATGTISNPHLTKTKQQQQKNVPQNTMVVF